MTEKEIKTKINNNEENTAKEFIGQLIELHQKQLLNENWKGTLLGLGLGTASLFGGASNTQAQTQTPNDTIGYEVVNQNGDTTRYMRDDYQDPEEWGQANKYFQKQLQKQTYNQQELMKLCPQAYKDMNKGPEIWKQNQNKYVYKNNNGQMVMVGKIAASHGQNPWNAILKNAGTKTTPIIKENIVKNKIIKNKYRNMKKQAIKLNETQLRNIIKESVKNILNEGLHRTNITFNGLNLELSMNGEDIIIEYADDNMWVLAIYCANDKTWHIQENLDNYSINNDEENIIDIGDTKSMPEALLDLSTYVRNKKNNIRR